jgi:hypothetical protein
VNQAGTAGGNGYSSQEANVAISPDGRFIAFESFSTDLVTTPSSGFEVFERDLLTGTTTLVSVNRFGTSGSSVFSLNGISADGRFVLFRSPASDLVANDSNDALDIFVRDIQAGNTKLVSVNRFGTGSGNGASWWCVISADGRLVAFLSFASDLVPGDTNGTGDAFVRNLQTGTTALVSVNRTGNGSGNGPTPAGGAELALSAGPRVAFTSDSSDLVANDTNGQGDIFARPVLETDVTSPHMTVVLSKTELWPPNHNLAPITATITISDDFDPYPKVVLVSIVSNEPDSGQGDGDATNDLQGAAFGTDDRSFMLRAERSGIGSGRIYTITYRVTDAAGNARIVIAEVVVPRNQGRP